MSLVYLSIVCASTPRIYIIRLWYGIDNYMRIKFRKVQQGMDEENDSNSMSNSTSNLIITRERTEIAVPFNEWNGDWGKN